MNFSVDDRRHMARALELAARGLNTTHPNPRVGCVIASGTETIAEGWHVRAGGPHAEADALARADVRARGATAYVTLDSACAITLSLCTQYRLPETTRKADELVNKARAADLVGIKP